MREREKERQQYSFLIRPNLFHEYLCYFAVF